MAPILSICVPTYQRPELLARALESVVVQDGPLAGRVELLVSDSSPELSKAIVETELARWSGPTQYLTNVPPLTAIQNFNQCLSRSVGRYVLTLHDDDYLLPGSIATILDVIDQPDDNPVLLFGVDIVDERRRLRRRQAFRAERRMRPREALVRLLSDSSFVRMPALVIRRDVFDDVGMFDESVGNPTDFELMIRVFAKYGVTCQPSTISAYSVHPQATSSEMFHADTVAMLMVIFERARALGILGERTLRRCQADWFHHFILGGAYRQLRIGDLRRARTILSLFKLPSVVALGPSTRWRPVRWLFSAIVRMPPQLAAGVMRSVGRVSPERFWVSW